MRVKRNQLLILLLILLTTSTIGSNINIKNNSNLSTATFDNKNERSYDYNVPEAYEIPILPGGPVPDWDLNITGLEILSPFELNLSYLVDEILAGDLKAYEQVVEFKDNEQTIIGIDILQLIQDYADVWYAGELTFYAEDGYYKSLNTTEILYSYYPPALETADIKILLGFAVNGSYLPDSDWADKGALRLVCPSNSQISYSSGMWVSNVTEISITDRWMCHIFVNGELKTSVPADYEDTYTEIEYLTYNLTYYSESTKFEGPSVLSILDYINVSYDDITLFQAVAPDFTATINKTELIGEKPAILAIVINDEFFGFNKGPMRLVGGNLNSWNWLKNCHALYITVDTGEPTGINPGFGIISSVIALISIPLFVIIVRKRK